MKPGPFWGSAVLAAGLVTACVAWLFPYGLLALDSETDRHRAFLLTLWTAGVLAICFGGAGLLSAFSGVGFRDVSEAGSLQAAVDAHRDSLRRGGSSFYNFAGWTVSTGFLLVLIYFAAWLILRS